jgi:hypothetical protein
MYILEQSMLMKADIILTANKNLISKSIRYGTSSDFSHAILYVGGSSYIHSDSKGVHSGNTQRLLFDKESEVVVLRDISLTEKEKNSICDYARNNIGKAYSKKEALKTILPKVNINLDRQFCSRLVAQSYSEGHHNIVKDINYCSPQEIYESKQLKKIDNIARKASKIEIEFAESDSPIKKQEDITNNLLAEIRKITSQDIQTIDEISTFLIKNQSYDLIITDIIQESGYLSMYEDEMTKNPWRYSKSKFLELAMSKTKLLNLANFELNLFNDNERRYSNMFQGYFNLFNMYNLNYFKMNLDLYTNLLNSIYMQRSTMNEVILELRTS